MKYVLLFLKSLITLACSTHSAAWTVFLWRKQQKYCTKFEAFTAVEMWVVFTAYKATRWNNPKYRSGQKYYFIARIEFRVTDLRVSINTLVFSLRGNPATESSTGLHGPGPGPRPDPPRGPGLVAQIMFGFGPCSNYSNQTWCRTFRAFSDHYFFAEKTLFVVALILCLWHSRAPQTNPTDLIFSGIFVAAPPPRHSSR
jgi:hypothetical protein